MGEGKKKWIKNAAKAPKDDAGGKIEPAPMLQNKNLGGKSTRNKLYGSGE